MKGKERHLDRKPEKNSGKGEPREFACEEPAFSENGKRTEIKCAFGEIDPEERQQHGDAPEECVNEEFCRRAVAIFAAPNFDEQKRGNEAHLVKQKPENKILGGERAVERGLHDQHQRAKPATRTLGEKCERDDE